MAKSYSRTLVLVSKSSLHWPVFNPIGSEEVTWLGKSKPESVLSHASANLPAKGWWQNVHYWWWWCRLQNRHSLVFRSQELAVLALREPASPCTMWACKNTNGTGHTWGTWSYAKSDPKPIEISRKIPSDCNSLWLRPLMKTLLLNYSNLGGGVKPKKGMCSKATHCLHW